MRAHWIKLACALVLSTGLATAALAQSFAEGWDAFQAGNYRVAMENFLPLARAGEADSQFGMGVLYNGGAGVRQDYSEGLRWSLLAAQQGHVGGIVNVAKAFTNGWGTTADQQMANRYWAMAADLGDMSAQYTLAGRVRDGIGVKADPKEAARRFTIVVRSGNSSFAEEAKRQLLALQGGPKEKVKKETKVQPKVQVASKTLADGIAEWERRDYAEAVTILGRFAESGNATAQFYVGQAYQFGFGVEEDAAEAVRWLRLAAKQNLAGAVYALGKLFETGGPNLDPDDQEAVAWLTKATKLGVRAAAYDLAIHYRDGLGVRRNLKQAQTLFEDVINQTTEEDSASSLARIALALLNEELQPTKKSKTAEEPVVAVATAEQTPKLEVLQPVPVASSGPATILPDCGGADMPAFHSDQKRVALVIGMAAYQNVPALRNGTCDARAMSATLERAGFEVITGLDLDKSGLDGKVRDFVRIAQKADVSLFFYSGHGLQVNGVNYIVPVDAKVEDATALNFELFNMDTVTGYMSSDTKVGIVLIDACRDNPFAEKLARSLKRVSRSANVGQGLAAITPDSGGGLVIGFATAPGDTAADGEGAHSPFTTALLESLPASGVEFELVMKRVKARVVELTEREPTPQRPWTNSDLTTEFYLVPPLS